MWFKIDDRFYSHPKVIDLPLKAVGLWTLAGTWSMDQLTDGFVPKGMLRMLNGAPADAKALVASGLWVEVPGGWKFHDWEDMQPSAESVRKKRADDAARKAAARDAKASKAAREATLKVVS